MTDHLWHKADTLNLDIAAHITEGFSLGFDSRIPAVTKNALIDFVYWVEDHFSLPVTLWVDFKYNHYFVDDTGKRVGYKFYWADFKDYPHFDNPDDIPVIELAVRREHASLEEILFSFIEAISLYYAWLANCITKDYRPQVAETAEILYTYLNEQNQEEDYGDL